jgi:hypothetical protein
MEGSVFPESPEVLARRVLAQRQAGAGAHAVLGLTPGASAADVRTRYKQARRVMRLKATALLLPASH